MKEYLLNLIEQLWEAGYLAEEDYNTAKNQVDIHANVLEKKYSIETGMTYRQMPNPDNNDEIEPVLCEQPLVKFSNVICKFRPHLHMGDYYLDIIITSTDIKYKYRYKVDYDEENIRWDYAKHPHMSNGQPCLGTFGAQLNTAIKSCNFLGFFNNMAKWLQNYTGRDTYVAGSRFKKKQIVYALNNYRHVIDTFGNGEADDYEGNQNLDITGILKDGTRWGYPQDIPALGTIPIQGQELSLFKTLLNVHDQNGGHNVAFSSSNFSDFTYMGTNNVWIDSATHNYATYRDYDNDPGWNINKIMGYIFLVNKFGDYNLIQSIEFVRIFLLTLYSQYTGSLTPEAIKQLKSMSDKLNQVSSYNNNYRVNNRYSVQLSEDIQKIALDAKKTIESTAGSSSSERSFMGSLLFAGEKIGNFITLISKGIPHKAKASAYLTKLDIITEGKIEECIDSYNQFETFIYRKALEKLKKDERRFMRELNKSNKVNHFTEDNGQGSLFS
tara:strand:- start:13261 stop:14751 length:1491 start_codon:yes stop_codon:yes gene_type:complete